MNVFEKLANEERARYIVLGNPSTDEAHFDGRMSVMKLLTGGKGFRVDTKEPRRRASDDTTRGDRKKAAYQRMLDAIKAERAVLKVAMAKKLKALKWPAAAIKQHLAGMPS